MKTSSIICHKCKTLFDLPKKELSRQTRNERTYFFCSRSCAQSFNKTTTHKIQSNCLWCRKPFETTTHKKGRKCCSKNCAVKYAQSFVKEENQSRGLKTHWKPIPKVFPKIYDLTCVICHNVFQKTLNLWELKNKPTQTCGEHCYSELMRKLARENPNCGGETNYKRYRYNGILMDSKWEVELAKWMDEKGIVWDRSKKRHQLFWFDENENNRRYYPDFFIPKINVYLDPKNPYLMKCDKYKIQRVMERNSAEVVCGNLDVLKKTLTDRCLCN